MADQISDKLDAINNTLKELIDAVKKPKENKFVRILEITVLIVCIFGIVTLIDIILKWVTGG